MILRDIAQKIVDKTMEIIDNPNISINIMDCDGFIIASGEKSRIDIYHKGAADVVKSGNYIEIFPKDVPKFPGAKEGVNMPISIQDKTVGVVGIYGHPDKVRVIAKLVKMTVELAVEQHLLSEQVKLVKDLKQELIRKLIYGKVENNEEELLCLSKIVGIDLSIKRRCMIIEIKDSSSEDSLEALKKINQIDNYLINNDFINVNDFSGDINQLYVIFKANFNRNIEVEKDYAERLSTGIYNTIGEKVKVSIGSLHDNLTGYRKSFWEARTLQGVDGQEIKDINNLDVKVNYILYNLDDEIVEHFVKPIYQKLLDNKGNIQMWIVDTLKCLFFNNLNVSQAANDLFIHRNTLLYRINKIEEITGLSINTNFYDAVLLKLLLIYINKYI